MENYNYSMTPDEFKKYDKGGNGIINFGEFMDWLKWLN